MPRNISENVEEAAEKSHIDRLREIYDTSDMGAIMSRFRSAVGR